MNSRNCCKFTIGKPPKQTAGTAVGSEAIPRVSLAISFHRTRHPTDAVTLRVNIDINPVLKK